jgi:excisionase family DNA binding protein
MYESLQPVRDAARRLGISIWTLRKKAYTGEVASVKIGAKLLIPESEIERLIHEGLRPRQEARQQPVVLQ